MPRAGDVSATGIPAAARDRGLRVPEDVAVLGYDDHELARMSYPPLSTLREPLEEMAGRAWQLSTEETREIIARPQKVLLKPVLVRRAST